MSKFLSSLCFYMFEQAPAKQGSSKSIMMAVHESYKCDAQVFKSLVELEFTFELSVV